MRLDLQMCVHLVSTSVEVLNSDLDIPIPIVRCSAPYSCTDILSPVILVLVQNCSKRVQKKKTEPNQVWLRSNLYLYSGYTLRSEIEAPLIRYNSKSFAGNLLFVGDYGS
jgi:hypothetical protein